MPDPNLLDLPTTVETPRLLLRAPRSGDGPALFEAWVESMPALRRFLASLPWVAADPTADSAEAHCRKGEANFIARSDLPFLVFDKRSQALLASVGLHRTVWETPKTEVGYWCRTSACGQGYATEAVLALTGYAFTGMKAQRVELVTDVENTASRRVAERAGYELERLLRNERRAPDGSLRNTCIYARLPGSR